MSHDKSPSQPHRRLFMTTLSRGHHGNHQHIATCWNRSGPSAECSADLCGPALAKVRPATGQCQVVEIEIVFWPTRVGAGLPEAGIEHITSAGFSAER